MNFLKDQICNSTAMVLLGIVMVCYYKTIKQIMISRCTDIDCCMLHCKRDVIKGSEAIKLAEEEGESGGV
jgi:hypothetical protein